MSCTRRMMVALIVISGGLLLMLGCSGPVAPVTSFDTFNATDGTVQCKAPAGWKRSGGGSGARGFLGVVFSSGSAKIEILADTAGSAIGDLAKSGMAGADLSDVDPELAEELSPVAQVHNSFTLRQAADDFGELDVKATETFRTGLGDVRKSEFTCSGTFGGSTHGYIATALGRDKRIRVICTCSEDDWKTAKPAFDEVIASLDVGHAE